MKIKNVSGEDRIVPALGDRLVLAGQVIDVPDKTVEGFTCQTTTWQAVTTKSKES